MSSPFSIDSSEGMSSPSSIDTPEAVASPPPPRPEDYESDTSDTQSTGSSPRSPWTPTSPLSPRPPSPTRAPSNPAPRTSTSPRPSRSPSPPWTPTSPWTAGHPRSPYLREDDDYNQDEDYIENEDYNENDHLHAPPSAHHTSPSLVRERKISNGQRMVLAEISSQARELRRLFDLKAATIRGRLDAIIGMDVPAGLDEEGANLQVSEYHRHFFDAGQLTHEIGAILYSMRRLWRLRQRLAWRR